MSTYITSADITDRMLLATGLSTLLTAKLTLSDTAVIDMAESKGVDSTSINLSPVHYQVKRYAIAWVGREMCFDLMGLANTDGGMDLDKYKTKYDVYNHEVAEAEGRINFEILTGTSQSAQSRGVGSGFIFRG